MHATAIIAAGGRGRRLGAGTPKQLLDLGGRPMLQWSVDAFLACEPVRDVVVVGPPEWLDAPPACLDRPRVRLVAGGDRRQDSVANGFDVVSEASDVVLVHDAARPFVDVETIERAIAAAAESGAAVVAVPARDTVKWSPADAATRAGGPVARGCRVVERTMERESVFLAQTPQAFRRDVLAAAVALGRAGAEGTDEAALAEQAGHRVWIVAGSARNMKVTTAEDLAIAEALVRTTEPRPAGSRDLAATRIGSGYDLHRLVGGRPMILGGVTIPFERGLDGHSDADALCHAVTDAILGAASLGDIGQHFPDSDDRWRDASSIKMLRRAAALVSSRGYRIVNVDATIVAERPRLGPYRASMASGLATALGIEASCVSVKAKTNEGVDATGRGEAIAVHAVALLEQRAAGSGQPAADSDRASPLAPDAGRPTTQA
jgi:2-C-methyl-D-erythritol 4-phosphate cytidylyltransferase / 2-C-methyl-D-erythritol 2,4-cyclodiphosphate synthase